MKLTHPRNLFDTKATSELLKVPTGTLSNWRSRNYGPAYFKVGQHVRYDEEDLRRWLARNRVEPEPQQNEGE